MSIQDAEQHFVSFLASLGLPSGDSEIESTPGTVTRFLKRFVEERPEPSLTRFEAKDNARVELNGFRFYSLCVHHLLPFFGTIDIVLKPTSYFIGFGGFDRTIEHFSRRLQLQERMTNEIADFLYKQIEPEGLAVRSVARQMCVEMGGGSPEVVVTTIAARGSFRELPVSELFTCQETANKLQAT